MSLTKEQFISKANKRIKANQIFFNNTKDGLSRDAIRGMLVSHGIIKKPKSARHLVLILLLGDGVLHYKNLIKLSDNKKLLLDNREISSNVYPSSKSTNVEYVGSSEVLQKSHCNAGRLRSFDDLVCMVNYHFPKVHYLKILEYFITTSYAVGRYTSQTDTNSLFSGYIIKPSPSACSTMSRIRCSYSTEQIQFNSRVSNLELTNNDFHIIVPKLKINFDDVVKVLDSIKKTQNASWKNRRYSPTRLTTSRYGSIKTWQELHHEYFKKYNVQLTDVPTVVLDFRDFIEYYK